MAEPRNKSIPDKDKAWWDNFNNRRHAYYRPPRPLTDEERINAQRSGRNLSFRRNVSDNRIIPWTEAAEEYNQWARSEFERLSKIYKEGKRDGIILSGLLALTGMVSTPASAGGAALFFAPDLKEPKVILLPKDLSGISLQEQSLAIKLAENHFGKGKVDYSKALQGKPVDLGGILGFQGAEVKHSRPISAVLGSSSLLTKKLDAQKYQPSPMTVNRSRPDPNRLQNMWQQGLQKPGMIDPFTKKPIRFASEVGPNTPLDKKYHWVFPPEIVTHSRPHSNTLREMWDQGINKTRSMDPSNRSGGDWWKIPTGRTDAFPHEISRLPMGERQPWLRSYYRANPIAAQQARSEARKIIDWAHRTLR